MKERSECPGLFLPLSSSVKNGVLLCVFVSNDCFVLLTRALLLLKFEIEFFCLFLCSMMKMKARKRYV